MTSGLKNSPSQSASSTSERPKDKAKASKAGRSKTKICIALIGGLVIVAVCIIVAVYFLVINSKTEAEPNIPKELVFAHIVFGNGAQPGQPPTSDFFGKKLEEKFKKQFPRGETQLIDRGYQHSQLLGKFLKKRYVDSGFLNSQMNPKEVRLYF
uniref:Uncharacterized protein n=2 Tax=Caenorhabditis japonica TaxID=281687 RepID=A0A8R1DGA9_CAEJA